MHCFYTDKENISDSRVRLTGTDVNHIKNVLRMEKGERITVCDGEGTFYQCVLEELDPREITADIIGKEEADTELKVRITLFQGLPKRDKLELIIQKAVELGVDEIVPTTTRFCVAKIEDRKKEKKKLERWQSICEAAAKQSGRGKIPVVKPPISYKEAVLCGKEMERALIPYEKAEGMQAFQKAAAACAQLPAGSRIGIFIGPEGGFSEEEIALAREAGILPISLGKRILRTETAGLCILSVLMLALEAAEEGQKSEEIQTIKGDTI